MELVMEEGAEGQPRAQQGGKEETYFGYLIPKICSVLLSLLVMVDPACRPVWESWGDGDTAHHHYTQVQVMLGVGAQAQRVATVDGGVMVRGSDDAECGIPVVEKQNLKAEK
jgi:hypothetical protein